MEVPINVRPSNKYQELENENRNMYESVALQNDGTSPLELWYRSDGNAQKILHGVIQPGMAMNVPKFLAEYYALRNEKWHIVSTSEPEVAATIEALKEESSGLESEHIKQAMEVDADKARTKKAQANKAKIEAEDVLENMEE